MAVRVLLISGVVIVGVMIMTGCEGLSMARQTAEAVVTGEGAELIGAGSPALATFTITKITPARASDCVLIGCRSNGIQPEAPPSQALMFHVTVNPREVIPEVRYFVLLRSLDGFLQHEEMVFWSEEDLAGADPNERKVTVITQANKARKKKVSVGTNYNDKSAPPFIADYNEAFDAALERYKERAYAQLRTKGLLQASPAEPFVFAQEEVQKVFRKHFNLTLIEMSTHHTNQLEEITPR